MKYSFSFPKKCASIGASIQKDVIPDEAKSKERNINNQILLKSWLKKQQYQKMSKKTIANY